MGPSGLFQNSFFETHTADIGLRHYLSSVSPPCANACYRSANYRRRRREKVLPIPVVQSLHRRFIATGIQPKQPVQHNTSNDMSFVLL